MPKASRREGVTRRVTRLEGRVDHLEDRVVELEQDPTATRPTDPRARSPEKVTPTRSRKPRCPGCHLEIATRRQRSCEWCGFVLAEGL